MDQAMPQGIDSVDSQIIEFIAAGMPGVEVASMLGVSLPAVQEKIKNLKELIQSRGKELRAIRVETKYATTEEKILNRIQKEAEDDMTDVMPLIRALEVISKNRIAYRSPAGLGAPALTQNNTTLNLYLPAAAAIAPSVTLNSQGEIIAVGSRNMASMPIDGVQEIFDKLDKQANGGTTHENAGRSESTQLVPASTSA